MMHFLTWRRAFSDIRVSLTDSNKEGFRHDVIRAQNLRVRVVRMILFCYAPRWRSGNLRKFWLLDVLTLRALDGVWRLLEAGYQIYFNQPGRTNVTVITHISWTPPSFLYTGLTWLLYSYWFSDCRRLSHVNELVTADLWLIW